MNTIAAFTFLCSNVILYPTDVRIQTFEFDIQCAIVCTVHDVIHEYNWRTIDENDSDTLALCKSTFQDCFN